MGKDSLVTSSQVITSPFTEISTNMKNLLHLIIAALLVSLTLGVNTSFAQKCGPGAHWMDNCPAGVDTMPSGIIAGINLDTSLCWPSTSFTLRGPIKVLRQASMDIVVDGDCGSATVNGHKDVILTEIDSMVLTGEGITLYAGISAAPEVPRSLGQIVELPGDNTKACSFFDVYFKLVTPFGTFYNHQPLKVKATIDRVPPAATYEHLNVCIGLYDSPVPGQGTRRANLTQAQHITSPVSEPTSASDISTRILNLFQGVYTENSKSASISWEMPAERDNGFYLLEKDDNIYIERSRDGVHFKRIGSVMSSGNANTANYSFTDPYPLPLGYYRLQFNSSGKLSHSQVITVASVAGGRLTISPNPTSGKIRLLLKNMQLSAVDVTVYDSYGRLVLSRRIGKGGQPEIDISGLSNGTYLVQCRQNGVIHQQKVVKK